MRSSASLSWSLLCTAPWLLAGGGSDDARGAGTSVCRDGAASAGAVAAGLGNGHDAPRTAYGK